MPESRVVHLLTQVCGALGEAHARGLVHRDLKPSNVIVCERGGIRDVAKLLDFGLVATTMQPADARLTMAGTIVGTPAFMSPEQCAGDVQITASSDIYSLAALAYYLLTGQAVFANRSPMQMLAAHLYEAPKPMRDHGVIVSPHVESAIMRCLSKDRADRFATVAEVEDALRGASVIA
jgi:serine/threonine-protein kinase